MASQQILHVQSQRIRRFWLYKPASSSSTPSEYRALLPISSLGIAMTFSSISYIAEVFTGYINQISAAFLLVLQELLPTSAPCRVECSLYIAFPIPTFQLCFPHCKSFNSWHFANNFNKLLKPAELHKTFCFLKRLMKARMSSVQIVSVNNIVVSARGLSGRVLWFRRKGMTQNSWYWTCSAPPWLWVRYLTVRQWISHNTSIVHPRSTRVLI